MNPLVFLPFAALGGLAAGALIGYMARGRAARFELVEAHQQIKRMNASELRDTLAEVGAVPPERPDWPEWGSAADNSIHRSFENAMRQALDHCYGSADASGLSWTMEGFISVSAGELMALLKKVGSPPPLVGDEVELEPMPVDETWDAPDDDEPVELYDYTQVGCPLGYHIGAALPCDCDIALAEDAPSSLPRTVPDGSAYGRRLT